MSMSGSYGAMPLKIGLNESQKKLETAVYTDYTVMGRSFKCS